ncbi:MAG: universal stress protein [Planctomycetes bacterium]|nr:universal stress protein [Planctomycetota bacterium]
MNESVTSPVFQRILCCVAQAATSDGALQRSLQLAQHLNARLQLLHVVPPIFVPPLYEAGLQLGGVNADALSRSQAEHARTALRTRIAHRHADATWRGTPLSDLLEVEVGTPVRVVLERVQRDDIDLVVLGDSGRRKQLDLGGLARALYSRASCPIWMQVDAPRRIERILVPIDGSESSALLLDRACDLARSFKARVHALECFVSPELYYGAGLDLPPTSLPYALDSLRNVEREAFEHFVENYAWQGVEHSFEFVDDDPARAILAAQEHYDLIVMGTQGRSALASALLGSVTWQVLRLARTPILTLRAPQRVLANA